MNSLRLSEYPNKGIKVEIDGREIIGVKEINLNCTVRNTPQVELNVFTEVSEVVLDAQVRVLFTVLPGFELNVEQISTTLYRYTISRVKLG